MGDRLEGFRRLVGNGKTDEERALEWAKEHKGTPAKDNAPTVLPEAPQKQSGTPAGKPGSEDSQRI